MSYPVRPSMSPQTKQTLQTLAAAYAEMTSPQKRLHPRENAAPISYRETLHDGLDWSNILETYIDDFGWDNFLDNYPSERDKNMEILLKILFIEKDHPLELTTLVSSLKDASEFEIAKEAISQVSELIEDIEQKQAFLKSFEDSKTETVARSTFELTRRMDPYYVRQVKSLTNRVKLPAWNFKRIAIITIVSTIALSLAANYFDIGS
ncbi:MAG: hypothetical protein K1060chlam4_00570 [Candidatus Anoxychlamydiales bacterium]|nr:hypothetical protein [Candidatus Anoxychlamydiales bacterium]